MRGPLPGLALIALVGSSAGFAAFDESSTTDVLVVVESLTTDSAPALLDRGVTVVWTGGDFLLAVTGGEAAAGLRDAGFVARAIDRDPQDATYYVISPAPSDRGTRLPGSARLVWSTRGRALVDIPEGRVGDLLDAGFEIARVFLTPIQPPRDRTPLRRREPAAPIPSVSELVGVVDGDRIDAHVQRLADFGTRYAPTDSARAAAAYIESEFVSYGIDSVEAQTWGTGAFAPNVIAVIPGTTVPDEIVVVGAHYDSWATENPTDAPGADDNASGTALVLEVARVLAGTDYARTLVFIAFGAEELGLVGSHVWVNDVAIANDLNIVAMLNADMVGYSALPELDLTLITDPLRPELRDLMLEVGADYVPELPLGDGVISGGTSDHASFWQGGYPAIMFFEDALSPCPFIHTYRDEVGTAYNAPLLAYRTARLGVAFLATLADPVRLSIAHDPFPDTQDTVNPYRIAARLEAPDALDPDSLLVHYAVDGSFVEIPLVATGAPDEYEAYIPAQGAGRFVDYYLVAGDVAGGRVTDPPDAPAEKHTFFVGMITDLFVDDFESSSGWRGRLPGDDATGGLWMLVDPNGTGLGLGLGELVQPEFDHTPGESAVLCYVTGDASPGAPVGEADVDGGRTTLESPVIDLSGYGNARLTYYRWFANSASAFSGADEWVVRASADGGATWVELERLEENRRGWERVELELADYIPLTSEVRLRFIASDEDGEDVVEAALDDVSVRSYEDPATPIDPSSPTDPTAAFARLVSVVPNPYGAHDAIRLGLPAPARPVTVRIYDVGGRLVRTLLDGEALAGAHVVRWNGRDAAGRSLASGRYFVRVRAGSESMTSPFMLVH